MLCLPTQDFPVSTDPEDRTFRDFSDYNPAFSISAGQQVPNRAVGAYCRISALVNPVSLAYQGRRQRSAEKVVVLAVVLQRCGPEVDSPKIGPTKTPGLRHEIGHRIICGPLPDHADGVGGRHWTGRPDAAPQSPHRVQRVVGQRGHLTPQSTCHSPRSRDFSHHRLPRQRQAIPASRYRALIWSLDRVAASHAQCASPVLVRPGPDHEPLGICSSRIGLYSEMRSSCLRPRRTGLIPGRA